MTGARALCRRTQADVGTAEWPGTTGVTALVASRRAMDECTDCQQSLAGSDMTAPWEDGDNPSAYTTCRHCGTENVLEGFGED